MLLLSQWYDIQPKKIRYNFIGRNLTLLDPSQSINTNPLPYLDFEFFPPLPFFAVTTAVAADRRKEKTEKKEINKKR
jgi:hypothetical protein